MGLRKWLKGFFAPKADMKQPNDRTIVPANPFNPDDLDFGNIHFRAKAAEALNLAPTDLSCVGPTFIQTHLDTLRTVWLQVQRDKPYTSTKADREYRKTAHLLPSKPIEVSTKNGAVIADSGLSDDNTLLNVALVTSIMVASVDSPINSCDP